MKNIILLFLFNILSFQILAMRKDSLHYRNSIEFNYQRNYSFYKIISYSDAIVKDATQQLNAKQNSESAIYTNIVGFFYTFKIMPWIYIRSGFSTGTIGYVSEPELQPIYIWANHGQSSIIGYEKVSEIFPGAFINFPIQLGFQKKIRKSNFSPFILLGYEGIWLSTPFLRDRKIETFEGSLLYKFKVEKKYDLSNTTKKYSSGVNLFSISGGINYNLKRIKISIYYQYRGGKKYQNNIDHWAALYIYQRGFSHGLGIGLGYNF
jgi:hypothetical protein